MQLAHNVYFTLNDSSETAQNNLVASAQKYLTDHPGTVFFAVGRRDEECLREVNDQDFHVALGIVFVDQAAHDDYQTAPRHDQFIDENKSTWKQVRVFDSRISPVAVE